MTPEISKATDEDFVRFFKTPKLETWWTGYCIREGGLVRAIAGVLFADDGRYFAFMDLGKVGRYPLVFRRIWRFLEEELESEGIDELFTMCDERYSRARVFLKRLGFKQTDELVGDERIWVWRA